MTYVPEGIIISRRKLASDLIKESGFTPTHKVATPLPVHLKLQASNSPLYQQPTHYHSLIGKLNFLTHTRPDISYAVQSLSQYMQHPTDDHYSALLHTVNYVAHTLHQGILLQGSPSLQDFDWGACVDTRRFVTGYVSKSSSEAE